MPDTSALGRAPQSDPSPWSLMNRRNFLGLLVGTVAASKIPLPPLAQKRGDYCVRYVEAFDIEQGKRIHRLDVLRGGELQLPPPELRAHKVSNVSQAYVETALKSLADGPESNAAIVSLMQEVPHMKDGQWYVVSWF